MSQFMKSHTVYMLIGSPRGQLIEIVRIRPNTVVLCDVLELMHPILTHGMLQVGEGRSVDFIYTIVIMTGARPMRGPVRRLHSKEDVQEAKDFGNILGPTAMHRKEDNTLLKS
ncbi:hypothetical protein V6N12_018777 [Hibiscus sabdariffa]|uniref:ATPase AAA-type core domain-containing protein n=1 Tax=Hibiscus sabdariffa TaxID=183260 RepID=A0ABR2A7U1_9ROSI